MTWLQLGEWHPVQVWQVFGQPKFAADITWVGLRKIVEGIWTLDMSFTTLAVWAFYTWAFLHERNST